MRNVFFYCFRYNSSPLSSGCVNGNQTPSSPNVSNFPSPYAGGSPSKHLPSTLPPSTAEKDHFYTSTANSTADSICPHIPMENSTSNLINQCRAATTSNTSSTNYRYDRASSSTSNFPVVTSGSDSTVVSPILNGNTIMSVTKVEKTSTLVNGVVVAKNSDAIYNLCNNNELTNSIISNDILNQRLCFSSVNNNNVVSQTPTTPTTLCNNNNIANNGNRTRLLSSFHGNPRGNIHKKHNNVNVRIQQLLMYNNTQQHCNATVQRSLPVSGISDTNDRTHVFPSSDKPTGIPQPPSGIPQPLSGIPQPPSGIPQPPSGIPQPPSGIPQPPSHSPFRAVSKEVVPPERRPPEAAAPSSDNSSLNDFLDTAGMEALSSTGANGEYYTPC